MIFKTLKSIKRLISLVILIVLLAGGFLAYKTLQDSGISLKQLLINPVQTVKKFLGDNSELKKVLDLLEERNININRDRLFEIANNIENPEEKITVLKDVATELSSANPDYDKVKEQLEQAGIDLSDEELRDLIKKE